MTSGQTLRFGLAGLTAQTATLGRRAAYDAMRTTLRAAELADAHGFDAVWTSEHHGATDCFMPAPLSLLAAVAQATDRVRVGTNVLLAPLWDPIRLAEEAAVVDQLSGGRLVLGLGAGYMEHEFHALGIDFRSRAERLERTIEFLQRAWQGEPVASSEGADAGRGIVVSPPPLQEPGPPIWVGGFVRRAVERARRLGSGYIGPTIDAGGLRERIDWLLEDGMLSGFSVSVTVFAFVGAQDDPAASEPAGHGYAAPRPDGAGHAVRAFGAPASCAEQLRPLADVLRMLPDGMEGHLAVCLSHPGATEAANLESVRLFGDEVIPALIDA